MCWSIVIHRQGFHQTILREIYLIVLLFQLLNTFGACSVKAQQWFIINHFVSKILQNSHQKRGQIPRPNLSFEFTPKTLKITYSKSCCSRMWHAWSTWPESIPNISKKNRKGHKSYEMHKIWPRNFIREKTKTHLLNITHKPTKYYLNIAMHMEVE